MDDTLTNYFAQYNANLEKKLGKNFSYGDFFNAVNKHSIKIDGFQELNADKKIELPWLGELEIVTEKIMSIASKPRTHIRFEKDVRRAEQAVKIDNYDIIETLKVAEFWHLKDERYLPEKVYTDIHEIDMAIYENRFLVNLIDKMIMFLSQNISQIIEIIKKINRRFIDDHVPVSDVDIIKDIAGYDIDENGVIVGNRTKSKEFKVETLLTQSSSPYVDLLRRLLGARSTLSHVLSTPFYKVCKKARPLPDSGVHITNMLAGDKLYAPCYTFYLHLLPMLSLNKVDESNMDYKDYHNYVLTNLLVAFEDIGFVNASGKKNTKVFNSIDRLLILKNYELVKNNMSCTVHTNSEDHIDLVFELKTNKKDGVSVGKKINKVSIDLVPTTNSEYTSDQELIPYFRKKINSRMAKGYTNAFIVTTVDNTQKEDVIICSPKLYKIDANVRSMIESCIIFAEGDNFIYKTICPVCGYYVDGELEDGNCYCANCDSVYSVFENHVGKETKETVWIKRLKNPEQI